MVSRTSPIRPAEAGHRSLPTPRAVRRDLRYVPLKLAWRSLTRPWFESLSGTSACADYRESKDTMSGEMEARWANGGAWGGPRKGAVRVPTRWAGCGL